MRILLGFASNTSSRQKLSEHFQNLLASYLYGNQVVGCSYKIREIPEAETVLETSVEWSSGSCLQHRLIPLLCFGPISSGKWLGQVGPPVESAAQGGVVARKPVVVVAAAAVDTVFAA